MQEVAPIYKWLRANRPTAAATLCQEFEHILSISFTQEKFLMKF
jgi:hypothetical protein